MTLRALDTLRAADLIACEDTRVTGRLLAHFGLGHRPLRRHDDHASEPERVRLIEAMRQGAVALVSDAGMPLISDPGYRLVREARAAGVEVRVVPGACAPVAALALSGLPNDRFVFAGFLPARDQARRAVLAELAPLRSTLIFLETAPRLARSLALIGEIMPGREVAVARELTKLYEECRSGTAPQLQAHYEAHPPRGEIVLLIGPPIEETADPIAVQARADAMLRALLEVEKPSRAAAEVARATGLDRKALYDRALELRRP